MLFLRFGAVKNSAYDNIHEICKRAQLIPEDAANLKNRRRGNDQTLFILGVVLYFLFFFFFRASLFLLCVIITLAS